MKQILTRSSAYTLGPYARRSAPGKKETLPGAAIELAR